MHTVSIKVSRCRVTWSSAAQPSEREVRLPAGERSCVIHKCYPGTNHYVRLYAMTADDQILDRSWQLTVQTNATPGRCNIIYIIHPTKIGLCASDSYNCCTLHNMITNNLSISYKASGQKES